METLRTPWSLRRPARAPLPRLASDHVGDDAFDVVVIGAGLAGLSVAWRLAEATDGTLRIAVLEAREPGFGASGRNAGMVPDFPLVTPWLSRATLRGAERVAAHRALRDLHRATMSDVGRLADRLAATRRTRFVLSTRAPFAGTAMHWIAGEAAAAGIDATTLEARAARAQLGWHATAACSLPATAVDPLAIVDGLVDRVGELGVSMFGGAQVDAVSTDAPRLRCRIGSRIVEAATVVLAGNAYAADVLMPAAGGRRPQRIRTHALLTAPLDGSVIQQLGGADVLVGEVGSGFAFRRVVDGRLLYGAFDVPDPAIAAAPLGLERTQADLRRHLEHRLPALAGVGVEAQWHGHFARTRTECPIIVRSRREPRVILATGFAGSGVGLALTAGLLVRGLIDPALDTAACVRVRDAFRNTRLGVAALPAAAVDIARHIGRRTR